MLASYIMIIGAMLQNNGVLNVYPVDNDAPAKVGGGGAMAANVILYNDFACRCSPVPLFTMISGDGPGGAGREIQ